MRTASHLPLSCRGIHAHDSDHHPYCLQPGSGHGGIFAHGTNKPAVPADVPKCNRRPSEDRGHGRVHALAPSVQPDRNHDSFVTTDLHLCQGSRSSGQSILCQGKPPPPALPARRWQAEKVQVSLTTHIPWHSVLLTFFITCLLSLIPLGSQIAFNIITSLSSIAIFSSYWTAIACRLANRFSANPVKPPRWKMGQAGIAVNVLALLFLTLGIAMLCFPAAPNPTADGFNWTVVIFSGVTILAIIYYFAYGRRVYISPRSRLTHYGGAGTADLVDAGAEVLQSARLSRDKAFA